MLSWLARLWESIKPDGYFYVAMAMELEGYTQMEIKDEIEAMRAADRKANDPSSDDSLA